MSNDSDTTRIPVLSSATVDGNTLVFHYTAGTSLDEVHKPGNGAFTVQANDIPDTVTAVAVDGLAKTVTLTLDTAVTAGQVVTVAYTAPTTNAIQDTTGNRAASLLAMAVTNDTPDGSPPVLDSATVDGNALVLHYTEETRLDDVSNPDSGAFAVRAGGRPDTVTAVIVNGLAKTVTLALATAVTTGQAVTVAYTAPTTGDDTHAIQDTTGNRAASLLATVVTNDTPDNTPPVLNSATVDGNALVLHYTEETSLDEARKPGSGAFAVQAGGRPDIVTAVTVDGQAKTVTLTLATAVTAGQAVTVAYTAPTAGDDTQAIQDAAGNHAASVPAKAVTNDTPDSTSPVLDSATVNGNTLVLHYTEETSLDEARKPDSGAFAVQAGGRPDTVTAVTVDGHAKTVTLTLATAVTTGQAVTVAYTAPTSSGDTHAIQDAAGNHAASLLAVINDTPDSTPPVLDSATINGNTLVLHYTEETSLDEARKPGSGAFAVQAGGRPDTVTAVTVDGHAKTVTLTLVTAVTIDQTVTVTYTAPTAGDDTQAIQDAAGNHAASVPAKAVTNDTPDSTSPVLDSATVNGNTLVLHYTEETSLDEARKPGSGAFAVQAGGRPDTVTAVTVDGHAKTVTLTLVTAVTIDQTVTVAYTAPTAGDDTHAIQDAAGNHAASVPAKAVTNDTPDSTPPVLDSATVNGNTLVLHYTEETSLDETHKPDSGAFAVQAGGSPDTVTAVAVDGHAKTVTLTLATAVTIGQAVTVAYTAPTTSGDTHAIQDAAGNHAASLLATAVTNLTAVPTPVESPTPVAPGADGATGNEVPVLLGPDGAAPVTGNGDGTGDGTQDMQRSIRAVISPTGASDPQGLPTTLVTLVDDSQDGKPGPDSSAHITQLEQQDAPGHLPAGLEMPIGLVHFQTTLASPGSSETFSLYIDPTLDANGSWVMDSSGVWANLASEPYGGEMVQEGAQQRLDFQITDGGPFDADGRADGSITVHQASAHMSLSIVGQVPEAGPGGFWF